MKNTVIITLIQILFLSTGISSKACNIHLKVSENYQKEKYAPNDEIIVEVTVIFEHRDCHTNIADTKFSATGCKIMATTDWNASRPNSYSRKLKVKILPGDEDISILCTRTCRKEGGFSKIELQKG